MFDFEYRDGFKGMPSEILDFDYWFNLENVAKENMEIAQNNPKKVLIEVASQHPLVDGLYPNEEFKARLDEAFRIYKSLGDCLVEFYIGGNIHKYNGVSDIISLSEAGYNYLRDLGVTSKINGLDLNNYYKGSMGVYNSTDECYVSSSYFKDGHFSDIYCVCSPSQLMRKAFSYIGFGILPQFFTADVLHKHHSFAWEYFKMIPMLFEDGSMLQGVDSDIANTIRENRKAE